MIAAVIGRRPASSLAALSSRLRLLALSVRLITGKMSIVGRGGAMNPRLDREIHTGAVRPDRAVGRETIADHGIGGGKCPAGGWLVGRISAAATQGAKKLCGEVEMWLGTGTLTPRHDETKVSSEAGGRLGGPGCCVATPLFARTFKRDPFAFVAPRFFEARACGAGGRECLGGIGMLGMYLGWNVDTHFDGGEGLLAR